MFDIGASCQQAFHCGRVTGMHDLLPVAGEIEVDLGHLAFPSVGLTL